jgi:hypothetical protein
MVVSRFARRDMLLSEEFVPTLAESAGLSLGADRSLGEYMVTGAAVVDGRLYAISAAHSTLLTLDLATHRIVAAHVVPGLTDPIGLASRGNDLYILTTDGTVTVVERPGTNPASVGLDTAKR